MTTGTCSLKKVKSIAECSLWIIGLEKYFWSVFHRFYCISVLEGCFLANSADSDEMQHYAAFHLGLHCLPKYLFRGFP